MSSIAVTSTVDLVAKSGSASAQVFATSEAIAATIDVSAGTDPLPGVVFQDQAGIDSHGSFLTLQGLRDALPPIIAHRVTVTCPAERIPAPTTLRTGRDRSLVLWGSFIEEGQLIFAGGTRQEVVASQAVTLQSLDANNFVLTVSGTPFAGLSIGGLLAEVTYNDLSVEVGRIYDFTDSTLSVARAPVGKTATSVRVVRESTLVSEFDSVGSLPPGSLGVVKSEMSDPNAFRQDEAFGVDTQRIVFRDIEFDWDAARTPVTASIPTVAIWHYGSASMALDRCLCDFERLGASNTSFVRLYSTGVFSLQDCGIRSDGVIAGANAVTQEASFRFLCRFAWIRSVWHSVSSISAGLPIFTDYAYIDGCKWTDCGQGTSGGLTLNFGGRYIDVSQLGIFGSGGFGSSLTPAFIRQTGACLRIENMQGGAPFIAYRVEGGGNGSNGSAAFTAIGVFAQFLDFFFDLTVANSYNGVAVFVPAGNIGLDKASVQFGSFVDLNLAGALLGQLRFGADSTPTVTFQSVRVGGGVLQDTTSFDVLEVL